MTNTQTDTNAYDEALCVLLDIDEWPRGWSIRPLLEQLDELLPGLREAERADVEARLDEIHEEREQEYAEHMALTACLSVVQKVLKPYWKPGTTVREAIAAMRRELGHDETCELLDAGRRGA